jgi:CRISPR-associated protein Cas1
MLIKIKEQETKLKENPPGNLPSLLAIEGIAAAAYFRYWYTLPLKWRGLNRNHIPPEWENIGTRIGNTRKSNQLANHPVNAILNYAYAILENRVRGYPEP